MIIISILSYVIVPLLLMPYSFIAIASGTPKCSSRSKISRNHSCSSLFKYDNSTAGMKASFLSFSIQLETTYCFFWTHVSRCFFNISRSILTSASSLRRSLLIFKRSVLRFIAACCILSSPVIQQIS